MKVLLDTHIALWAIADSDKLDDSTIKILQDTNNEVYYSVVSVWEIAIKHQINPINMPITEEDFVELCEGAGLMHLDILPEHIFTIKTLSRDESEQKHNDPFDRLLLSQAKFEDFIFITHDSLIPGYNETCIMKIWYNWHWGLKSYIHDSGNRIFERRLLENERNKLWIKNISLIQ